MDLLEHDTVVVRQKVKFIEVTSEYFLYDPDGNTIGWVVEEGQTRGHKWLRRLTKVGPMMAHQLAVADDGRRVMTLYKPRSWIKATVDVRDASGERVGTIRQENWWWGKARFTIEDAAGFPMAELRSLNWRRWKFVVADAYGNELAHIDKKWAGVLEEAFTTADNYVFSVQPTVDGPLRFLCFAAAIAIDQALKQISR